MNKKLIIIGSIILVVILGLLIWKSQKDEQREASIHKEWSEKRLPLSVKKEQLEQQLKDLEEQYQSNVDAKGTSAIVFTDLNHQVYSVCFPIMKKYEVIGTLALSKNQLPGKDGCITEKEFAELMEAGWSTCVRWDKNSDVSKWWPNLQKELRSLGIEPGKQMYFPLDTYKEDLDAQLKEMGFNTAICERPDGESPLTSAYEEGIWHVGAMGFMGTQPKNWLRDAAAQDANVIYLVNFTDPDKMYEQDSFVGMMQSFDVYEASATLLLGNLDTIREHYRMRAIGMNPENEQQFNQEKAGLEEELADVKKKLAELDAQYQ